MAQFTFQKQESVDELLPKNKQKGHEEETSRNPANFVFFSTKGSQRHKQYCPTARSILLQNVAQYTVRDGRINIKIVEFHHPHFYDAIWCQLFFSGRMFALLPRYEIPSSNWLH